jgi:hypothetical protein
MLISHQLVIVTALTATLAVAGCRKKAAEDESGDLSGSGDTPLVVGGDQPVTGAPTANVATGRDGDSTTTLGEADKIPPTAGTLSAGNGSTSIKLTWTKATDNKTAAAEITYCAYYSSSAAIAALTDILNDDGDPKPGVTAIGTCAKNITEKTATGLQPATVYYFNVVASDAKGNRRAYAGATKQTSTDIIDPVPSGSPAGTLTTSAVTASGMTLSWIAATDNLTSSMSLEYLVVYSTTSALDTIDDILNAEDDVLGHVVAVGDWTEDLEQAVITGLSPNTTYYLNVIVRDLAGNKAAYLKKTQATTADTTAPVPGSSGTITSSAIGNQSATLTWTKATDNASAQSALQYEVRRSSSNNIASVANAESNGAIVQAYTTDINSFNATGLSPATTYYFNVIARDAAGNKAVYATRSVTTLADGTAPTPGNSGTITTSAIGTTGLTLNWTKATDDISGQGTLEYRAFYSSSNNIGTVLDANANGTPVGAFATDINTVNVTGLTSATTYYFNVIVRDPAGNMAVYTTKSEATATDSTPPTPGNSGTITTASVGAQSLTLNWTAASDDTFASNTLQYRVFRSASNDMNSVANAEARTPENSYTTNIATLNVTGLSPSTTYYFNVVVRDGVGSPNKAIYSTVTVTTASDSVAPVAGNSGTITTASVGTTGMTLNWTKATDNADAQADLDYLAYYSTSNNLGSVANIEANGTPIGSYADDINTVNVTGLSNATTYYFNVIARDTANNKVAYSTVTQTTATDSTPPTPGNSGTITTAAVGTNSLTLNWTAGTDDTFAANTLQYRVFRSTTDDMASVVATEAKTAQNAFTTNIATLDITGLSPATTYYFNVVVRDGAGTPNKAIYARVQVTTSSDATAPVAGSSGTITTANVANTSLDLNWTKATDNVDAQGILQYRVYRSTSNNITSVANMTANGTPLNAYTTDIDTFNVTGLAANTTYYFNVMVKDAAGNEGAYATRTQATTADVTAPTPGNSGTLSASGVGTTSLTVNWTAGTDNAAAQAALEYTLYMSTSNNIGSVANAESNGTMIGTYATNITSRGASSLSPNTTYYFNVIVRDPAGNKAAYTSFSQTTGADSTPPTPGNTGTLSFASVGPTSLTVNWTKGSDDSYAQSTLQYQLCRSSTNNVNSVGGCEGATLVGGYVTDVATANVTGLSPSTTYYFNVIVRDPATNQAVYTMASQATTADTTPPTPGASGAMSTANVTATSLDVNWTKATDNVTAQASLQYQLYRSTSNNITSVANAEANGTAIGTYTTDISTVFVSSLTPGQTYYFNVVVRDGAGSPNKAAYTPTSVTLPSDSTAPTPGSSGNLTINGVQTTQITVNWTKATDAGTPQAQLQYLVYYSTSDDISDVASMEASGTPFGSYTTDINTRIVTGLAPGTPYFFNVIVRDNAGNKAAYNMPASATSTSADTTEPTVGTPALTSSSPNPTTVDLSWTRATDDSYAQAVLEYRVFYSTSNNITTEQDAIANGTPFGGWQVNIAAESVTGLTPNTSYYFNVVVRDPSLNDQSFTAKQQTSATDSVAPVPGASGALTPTMGTTSTVLAWTKATDNIYAQNTLQYRVYYSTTNNIGSVANAEANGTAFGAGYSTDINGITVTGLAASTAYYFTVIVKDSATPSNNKAVYAVASGTTGNDVIAPTAGNSGNMSTSSVQPASFTLTWTEASDVVTTSANIQYEVYRSLTNNIGSIANAKANGTLVAAYAAYGDCNAACNVSVTGLLPSTLYYYNVIARDEALNEVAYTMGSVTTAADVTPPVAGGSGDIVLSNVTKTGMTATFAKGADTYTPEAQLQYRACFAAASASIDTANECDALAVGSWETDVTSIVITTMAPTTAYFVNILVQDYAGNKGVYVPEAGRTASAVHIAYNNATNTDLKYASDTTGSMVLETVDTQGTYAGIALDAAKKPHIMYNRGTTGNGHLYYAKRTTGSWDVSSGAIYAQNSSWADLVLDSSGNPHATYYRNVSGQGRSVGHTTGDTDDIDTIPGSWVNTNAYDTANNIGTHSSIAIDANDDLHVVAYDAGALDVFYVTNESGSWVGTNIDGNTTSVASGAINGSMGTQSDIAVDSNGKVHIIYYDATNLDLRYATNASGSWVASTIASTGSVGTQGSIAIDGDDNLHVVYYDSTNTNVMYMKYDGTWNPPEILDGGSDSDTFNWTSCSIGSDGLLHVAYHNNTDTDLMYTWGKTGEWRTPVILDGATISAGKWNSIAAE